MLEAVQVLGALAIVIPYAWSQLGSMSTNALSYLFLNFVGSLTLAGLALATEQWGFLLLEVIWAAVALRGLLALRFRH